MNRSPSLSAGCVLVGWLAFALPATGQVLGTLKHSIPAPPVGVQAGGALGFSVAIEGGVTVVGAPSDDTGAQDSGAVKVFDSFTGALLHDLINPSPAKGEQFGRAVSISGTRLVVGTPYPPFPGTDPANPGGGSVYVYDLGSGTPTVPLATLDNPAPSVSDNFGYAVSISGTRVVVGAYNDDAGATNSGSAYLYDLGGPSPAVAVLTLNNPDPRGEDLFGYSVAIAETRVVIGVLKHDAAAENAGAVYI